MAGLLAALAAVAGVGFGQGAGDFNFYGTAEAGAFVHFIVPQKLFLDNSKGRIWPLESGKWAAVA